MRVTRPGVEDNPRGHVRAQVPSGGMMGHVGRHERIRAGWDAEVVIIPYVEAQLPVMDEDEFDEYLQRYRTMLDLERQVRWAQLQGREQTDEATAAAEQARSLRQLVGQVQQDTLRFITETWAELNAEPNPNAPETSSRRP